MQHPTTGPCQQPTRPPAPRVSSTPGLPPQRLPHCCEGHTMDQRLPKKQFPACHLTTTSSVPQEARELLGGGISLAVPIAQHAPVLTQKQIKPPDSTGMHMSPLREPAGTPLCPAATFADVAGALCILYARGILFHVQAPVNPAPHHCWVPTPEHLRALYNEFWKTP